MLTIEVKLNGEIVAHAAISNLSGLAEVSDYRVAWSEMAETDLEIRAAGDVFLIRQHRRRQTAWALVAKVVHGILGQMVDRMEGKG
jgi:hypothetical protein